MIYLNFRLCIYSTTNFFSEHHKTLIWLKNQLNELFTRNQKNEIKLHENLK